MDLTVELLVIVATLLRERLQNGNVNAINTADESRGRVIGTLLLQIVGGLCKTMIVEILLSGFPFTQRVELFGVGTLNEIRDAAAAGRLYLDAILYSIG
jgi:hypothetical protein